MSDRTAYHDTYFQYLKALRVEPTSEVQAEIAQMTEQTGWEMSSTGLDYKIIGIMALP
ncbi:MAG: hypothetical protein WA902_19320 [Thermosynechococcaceae cyanobacterium]